MRKVIILNGSKKEAVARFTWDGKKVESDNEEFFDYMKKEFGAPNKENGDDFLDQILARFRSGYMHAYQIGK